ncbi:MAG: DnaB-like helicase C-terminal domain-containing protein [Deltaproteobacteria bacterium]|nr:DnaB-like helicase C-terminal domain-containing protein [Deltaproteobacteria bacterium]
MRLTTGFHDLDTKLNGLHSGELIIIAGRPGMGKTALALSIVRQVAKSPGNILIFSLEMPAKQMIKRMLSPEFREPLRIIRSKNISDNGLEQREMSQMGIHIDDTPRLTMQNIVSKTRQMCLKDDVNLILIDYLQLLMAPRVKNWAENVTRSLKSLAQELGITILLLSQLNGNIESRENKHPNINNFREEGVLYANAILYPFRESVYCRKCREYLDTPRHNFRQHLQKAEIIIEKPQQGEQNISIPVTWREEFACFEPLEKSITFNDPLGCIHINPLLFKYYWWIIPYSEMPEDVPILTDFNYDKKKCSYARKKYFLNDKSSRLCTYKAIQCMEKLAGENQLFEIFTQQLPRKDAPFDPEHGRWKDCEWAPAYDDDSDPVWKGHK